MTTTDVCPCCGTTVEVIADPLVAACDMVVRRALELVGKRVARASRSRIGELGDRPWADAYLLWDADDLTLDKALRHAWDTVPALVDEHGCCGATVRQVEVTLDRYVRDLVAARQSHDVDELRYRLSAFLGVPLDHEAV